MELDSFALAAAFLVVVAVLSLLVVGLQALAESYRDDDDEEHDDE